MYLVYFVFNIQLCLLFVFYYFNVLLLKGALTLATCCLNGSLLDLYIIVYYVKGQTKLTFTWHTPNRVNIK